MSADGSMARTPELMEFAKAYGLTFITVADLAAYRRRTEVQGDMPADVPAPAQV